MGSPRTSWVKLNHLQTGVSVFTHSCTNGVLVPCQIASVAPPIKLQTTLSQCASYIKRLNSDWSDGFG